MNTKSHEHVSSIKISTGKKILLIFAICAIAFVQQSIAQNTSTTGPSELLVSYYNIKDALVNGDANSAAINSGQFVKKINSIGSEIFRQSGKEVLLKDAIKISATRDLKNQREYFSTFSANMIALTKEGKLSAEPVYNMYCPMKKATWLSSDKAIKNPYYGNAMLTCGRVTGAIQ